VDARVQAGDTARRVVVCFATFVMDEPAPMPEPMPMSEWTAAGSSRLVLAQCAAGRDLAGARRSGLADNGRRLAARPAQAPASDGRSRQQGDATHQARRRGSAARLPVPYPALRQAVS